MTGDEVSMPGPSLDLPPAKGLPELTGNPLLDARLAVGPVVRGDPRSDELVRRYAYGIPDEAALTAILHASPAGIVELGAGTGSWARLLHERGGDVVAFDLVPPPSPGNSHVDHEPWFPVDVGDEHVVSRFSDRTLLIVWPTAGEGWAGEAARRYHEAGGSTFVYVGEGDGGRTGDRTLHCALGADSTCLQHHLGVLDEPCTCARTALWILDREVPIPRWGDAADSCRIYQRAAPAETSARRWRRRRATA